MRLLFLNIGLVLNTCAFAQQNIALGDIRYDTAFSCTDSLGRRFNDRYFNISDICDSKNDLEIRYTMFGPRSNRTLIIFSFTENRWDIQQYKFSTGSLGRQLVSTTYTNLNDKWMGLDQQISWFLEHLAQNRIFLLPDESELNHEPQGMDGPLFQIAFKVGDKFRRYRYYYPEGQCEHYPQSSEYSYMVEIINTFRSLFN